MQNNGHSQTMMFKQNGLTDSHYIPDAAAGRGLYTGVDLLSCPPPLPSEKAKFVSDLAIDNLQIDRQRPSNKEKIFLLRITDFFYKGLSKVVFLRINSLWFFFCELTFRIS